MQTIQNVITAVSTVLGTPDRTGTFQGQPTASWGKVDSRNRFVEPGVDIHEGPNSGPGSVRVDLYLTQGRPMILIEETLRSNPNAEVSRKIAFAIGTKEELLAHSGDWPVIVPLNVAVAAVAEWFPRK